MAVRSGYEAKRSSSASERDFHSRLGCRRGDQISADFAALHESVSGTSVWTGRALQAESDDLEVIGLALLYPALERNVVFLAIMDIRAHPVSFSERPREAGRATRSRMRRRDRFSISSFQLADLGGKANYCYRDQLQTWGATAIPFHAAAFVTRAS